MGWSARSEAGSAGVCAASAFGSLFWKGGLCRGWGSCRAGGLTHRQSFVDGLIALRCGLRRGAGAGPPCAGAGGRRGPERSLTFRILRCPRSGRGGGLPSWPGLAAGGRSVFRVGGFPFAFVLVVCLGVCLVQDERRVGLVSWFLVCLSLCLASGLAGGSCGDRPAINGGWCVSQQRVSCLWASSRTPFLRLQVKPRDAKPRRVGAGSPPLC